MKKKYVIILEILIILIGYLYYVITISVPKLKSSFGSSDKFINTDNYANMIDISIDSNTSFSLLIDKNKKIYHIFFFSDNLECLYNKNIEGNNLDNGIKLVIKNLIDDNFFNDDSLIVFTRYNDKYYSEFKDIFLKELKNYNLLFVIDEEKSTLNNKASSLNISSNNDSDLLKKIDLYSKDNTINMHSNGISGISDDDAFVLSNNLYSNIEKVVLSGDNIDISKIPLSFSSNIFPNKNSWYYVRDSHVYAYIEFSSKGVLYQFCYLGSIDNYKKGLC